MGLAEERGGSLHGLVRLVPHDDLLIASDRLDVDGADRVAGVHRPSAVLAHLTIREPVERALDACTGNGIQALLLSRHAEHVVATDVNRRALGFAAFNLALNGVTNVELREGSLLEPVTGERFACIACNPPYVISPDAEFIFRDSGLPGDHVSELLERGLPIMLEPGGFATLMASWAQAGDDPAVRPREWLDRSGCDTWILHTTTDDPLSNAAAWTRDAVEGPDQFGAALDRWTALLPRPRDRGTRLRRTHAAPPGRRELVTRREPAAAAARARLEPSAADVGRSRRDGCGPGGAARTTTHGHTRGPLRAIVSPSDGWSVVGAALTLEEGLGFRADVDEPTLRLLRALDGSSSARDAVAASLGEEDVPRAAELLRGMLETGFLVPEAKTPGRISAPPPRVTA